MCIRDRYMTVLTLCKLQFKAAMGLRKERDINIMLFCVFPSFPTLHFPPTVTVLSLALVLTVCKFSNASQSIRFDNEP